MFEYIPKPQKVVKSPKKIKQHGKQANNWSRARAEWLRQHPADYRGMWKCTDCNGWFEHITLDHPMRRGSHSELRYDISLLIPVCAPCHVKRDSGMKFN